jgi:DNA-binding MarR family transcriptional regulator
LYDETDRDTWKTSLVTDIGEKLGFKPDDTDKIANYLHDEGLIEIRSKDRFVRITHAGIREVEEAIEHPEKPTEHFPINVINIDTMIDSQITQASPEATLITVTAEDRRTIDEAIFLLKEHMDEFDFTSEQKSDLRADTETIEAQMKSSKPKWTIIKESAASINGKLQPIATGSAIALQIIQLLSMLHH